MQNWQNTVHTFKFNVTCSIVNKNGFKIENIQGDEVDAPTYNDDSFCYNQFIRLEKNGIVTLIGSKIIKKEEKQQKKEEKQQKKEKKEKKK